MTALGSRALAGVILRPRSSESTRWASRKSRVMWTGRALEGRDLELLGHHVVDEGALDDLRHQQLVAPVAVVLPELDGDTDVRRDAALDPLLKRLGDGAEQHDVDRHLVVVEEDGEVADA